MTSKVTVEAVNGDVTVIVYQPRAEEKTTLDNGDVISREVYADITCIVKNGETRSWHVWGGDSWLHVEEKDEEKE